MPESNPRRWNPVVLALVGLQAVTTAALVVVATGAFRVPVPAPEPEPEPIVVVPDPIPVVVPVPVPAPRSQPSTARVVVAVRDIPVGTVIVREEVPRWIQMKEVPVDALPPGYVENPAELVGMRLNRSVRVGESLYRNDLTAGAVVTIPAGMQMVTIELDPAQAAVGFVVPGSKVDVLAGQRQDGKVRAFPLLMNMLVLAVDTESPREGRPGRCLVSLAVVNKQALLLELARVRGCSLSLVLRGPNVGDRVDGYDIDQVIKMLSDEPKGR